VEKEEFDMATEFLMELLLGSNRSMFALIVEGETQKHLRNTDFEMVELHSRPI
jgi:hypothetical protein